MSMYFILDAFYEVKDRKVDWEKPVAETMKWWGPYYDTGELDRVARAKAMDKIDYAYHRVRIVEVPKDT